jgi:hypothetical protein
MRGKARDKWINGDKSAGWNVYEVEYTNLTNNQVHLKPLEGAQVSLLSFFKPRVQLSFQTLKPLFRPIDYSTWSRKEQENWDQRERTKNVPKGVITSYSSCSLLVQPNEDPK